MIYSTGHVLFTALAGGCKGPCSGLCTLHSYLHLHKVGVKCSPSALVTLICTHLTLMSRSTDLAGQRKSHPQHPAVPGAARPLRTSCAITVRGISAISHSKLWESEAKELQPANPPLLPWQPRCHRRSGFYIGFFEGLEKEANIHLYIYSFAAHCYLCKWKRERMQNALKELRLSQSLKAVHFHVVFLLPVGLRD